MGLGGVAIAVPPYVIHPQTAVLGRAGGGMDSAEYSTYKCNIDLRTSGINAGLAVDLEWKSGITFDVDL